VLRSSWQTVNIGDIAHTPGMLALFEKYRPEDEVTLWPNKVDRGVEEILRARFPKLKIAKTKGEKEAALAECDFFSTAPDPASSAVSRRTSRADRRAGGGSGSRPPGRARGRDESTHFRTPEKWPRCSRRLASSVGCEPPQRGTRRQLQSRRAPPMIRGALGPGFAPR